jgi:SAM-dependent methyltransferase
MTGDVLRLPFDQYQRYRLVADVLDGLRDAGERLTVLDVGGRTALLRGFLERDDITLVDLEPADVREGLVLGDGARLPFRDEAFDVVAAFDTLEHVPPADREAFVAECGRVARRWCVLAGPYSEPRVVRAEELLRRFLRDKLAIRHRYLDEHGEHGLPDRSAVTAWLESAGARVAAVGQGNLHRWLFMMCVAMVLDDDPALRDLAGDVFAYYNEDLYASDTREPVYRHVVVAAMGDAPLPDLARLRAARDDGEAALSDPLLPVALMTAELVAFDRERAVWREERGAFQDVVADRDARLAEHRDVLAARDEELARYREAVERMERDLRWFPVRALTKLRSMFAR